MKVKTVSYKRTLNIGNYESKTLELHGELEENDQMEVEVSNLAQLVETKIREDYHLNIVNSIKILEEERNQLKEQIRILQKNKELLTSIDIESSNELTDEIDLSENDF